MNWDTAVNRSLTQNEGDECNLCGTTLDDNNECNDVKCGANELKQCEYCDSIFDAEQHEDICPVCEEPSE